MAIRTIIPEKQSLSMRCCMNPLEDCQGAKCMGWVQQTITEVSNSKSLETVNKVPTGNGYCGMVKG